MSTTNNAPRTSYDLGAQPGPNKYLLVRYLSPPDYPKEKVSELREISLVYKDRHTARKLVRRWARSQEPPVDPAGYELCLSEERLAAAVDPDRRVYTYGLKGDNKLVWVRRKVSLPDPATPVSLDVPQRGKTRRYRRNQLEMHLASLPQSNLSDIVRQTQERLPKRRRTSSRLIFFSDDEESEEEALSAQLVLTAQNTSKTGAIRSSDAPRASAEAENSYSEQEKLDSHSGRNKPVIAFPRTGLDTPRSRESHSAGVEPDESDVPLSKARRHDSIVLVEELTVVEPVETQAVSPMRDDTPKLPVRESDRSATPELAALRPPDSGRLSVRSALADNVSWTSARKQLEAGSQIRIPKSRRADGLYTADDVHRILVHHQHTIELREGARLRAKLEPLLNRYDQAIASQFRLADVQQLLKDQMLEVFPAILDQTSASPTKHRHKRNNATS